MYAQQVVEARLETAQTELGWTLEYHSTEDVDEFNRRLEQKYEKVYMEARQESSGSQNPTQTFRLTLIKALSNKLTHDEVRWVLNERYLCMCDAAYWMTRYYWIKNEMNQIQRFKFRKAQRIYFDAIAELELLGAAIEMIEAKARQLGISTVTEGLVLHRTSFVYGVNAIIASASRKQIGLMSQMLFMGYDMMPWYLPPIDTRKVQSDQGMLVFGDMQSGVSFQHGAQTSGIARGYTPTVYHLSEVAEYDNADELIEASLFKAVHPSTSVFGVLESTCSGDTGWWYDTYWLSKREWKNHRSRLYAQFLPWYLGTDIYPMAADKITHPIPQDWRPSQDTREMMARAKVFVNSAPLLRKVLGEGWALPAEQGWYWEWNYEEAKMKGLEKLWYQEMPTDDTEAFQGSYENVFGRAVIAEAFTQREREYKVYGIIGQSIEQKFEPLQDEIDGSKRRVPVAWHNNAGESYRWEFIPLKWTDKWKEVKDLADLEPFDGKLFVFKPPEPGYDYSIGVDTSSGIGSDATAIAVCRRARHVDEPDEQVAEFRSNLVSHVEAFAWVMAIAAYYGKHMTETTTQREPYVSIEQIAAVGDTCQVQMRKMGYGRFHRMIRYDSKDLKKSKSRKTGWYTSSWSRPMLTDGFVISVQNGWYIVHSPVTIWEMDHWEVHLTGTGKSKFEHSNDATDDGIFANAMATFCPNDLKSLAKRTKRRLEVVDTSRNKIDIGEYRGLTFPTSGGNQVENWRDLL